MGTAHSVWFSLKNSSELNHMHTVCIGTFASNIETEHTFKYSERIIIVVEFFIVGTMSVCVVECSFQHN